MKPTDERKARGWMKMHCKAFDNPTQLADAACDFMEMYDVDCKVPVRFVELATEVMETHK